MPTAKPDYSNFPGAIILPYKDIWPKIDPTAFIAPGAVVIGDVEIGAESSVWFNVTIRGDVNKIRIGDRTNIQDNAVLHVDRKKYGTVIGNDCTIGHSAVVHACTIGHSCLIGIQACVLDGATIEDNAMIAAAALVTPGKHIKSNELWAGQPAKLWREVEAADREEIAAGNANYVQLRGAYKEKLGAL